MKIKSLLLSLLTLITITTVNSQIKVNSSGRVGLGGIEPESEFNLTGEKAKFQDTYVYEGAGVGTKVSWSYMLNVYPNRPVTNTVHIRGNHNVSGAALYVNGAIASSQPIPQYSDRRFKNHIKNIDSLSLFKKLASVRGKTYKCKSRKQLVKLHNSGVFNFPVDTIYKKRKTLNSKGDTIKVFTKKIKKIKVETPRFIRGVQYGVVAQQVMKEFPELVTTDQSTGSYTVNYTGFIPVLIEGINIQQETISDLKKEIKKMKRQIKNLQNSTQN